MVMARAGLVRSHGAARRVIAQGGLRWRTSIDVPAEVARDASASFTQPGVVWLQKGRAPEVRVVLQRARTSAEVDPDPIPW